MTFAHVAGLPVEETLPALLPAACALALAIRARLAQVGRRLRRRHPDSRPSRRSSTQRTASASHTR
jgi:hypothetical protein